MRLLLLSFALLALFFGSVSAGFGNLLGGELHEGTFHGSSDDFLAWLGKDFYFDLEGTMNAPQLGDVGRAFLKKLESWAPEFLTKNRANDLATDASTTPYPYFQWIPFYQQTALIGGPSVQWEAPCFKDSSARAFKNADGITYTIELTLANPTSLFCNDFYLFGTVEGVKLQSFFFAGTHNITYTPKKNVRPAELWDIENKGFRIFKFSGGLLDVVGWVLQTVKLFEPLGTKAVSAEAAAVNLEFLEKYANIKNMVIRNGTVNINPDLIQSGDFLGVIRLDGLDPMLAWAMGAHTGHTTIAMRDGGVLYIMESTTNSTYWPTNGIQSTPFNIWIEQANAAGYNVVWSPLKEEVRAKFNVTAALEFFADHEGYDYGYYNMLMAWIDTPQDNYPCLPPDYKQCLRYEQIEILIGIFESISPAITDLLFGQAFNNRLGTSGLRAAELFETAAKQNIPYRMLPVLPELDTYVYKLNRNWEPTTGQSMVCCVFVCSMWKAGGIFDAINREVNCGELTNWDDYSLDILQFNPAQNHPECLSADPENPLCQIAGKYSVMLANHGSRDPYAHMGEKCSAEPPTYERPAGC